MSGGMKGLLVVGGENFRDILITPTLLVVKRGASLSFENLLKNRWTIWLVESLVLSFSVGSPPIVFRISSVSHVLRPFL